MRYILIPLWLAMSVVSTYAQTGPCTESGIQQGNPPAAEDTFMYMPPYGKPDIGKPAIEAANRKAFSDHTNIKFSWLGDHRILATPIGDMAYEYGTVHLSYDSKKEGGHQEFDAVLLKVYRAKDGVCQSAAVTMQPIEASSEGSANSKEHANDEQAIRDAVQKDAINLRTGGR